MCYSTQVGTCRHRVGLGWVVSGPVGFGRVGLGLGRDGSVGSPIGCTDTTKNKQESKTKNKNKKQKNKKNAEVVFGVIDDEENAVFALRPIFVEIRKPIEVVVWF